MCIATTPAIIPIRSTDPNATSLLGGDYSPWANAYLHAKKQKLAEKVLDTKQTLTASDRQMIYELLTGHQPPGIKRGRKRQTLRDMVLAEKYLMMKKAGVKATLIRNELWKSHDLPNDNENTFNKALRRGVDKLYTAATIHVEKIQGGDESIAGDLEEAENLLRLIAEYRKNKNT